MNMLFPWQAEHRANKKAILEYVQEKYPNSKKIGENFPVQKFPEFHKASTMYFELDGIEFKVHAEYGEIVNDGYTEARAIAQFDKIIKEGFMKPRDIDIKKIYTRYSFLDSYKEMYPYTGGLAVEIFVHDQGSSPKEVGWLYDFYKYWKIEGAFLTKYAITIKILEDHNTVYHINYNYMDDFLNENAFYAAFRGGT